LRNWVEYGLKQSKNELGWADFRMTSYAQIERWWEIVMSAYLLVSLHTSLLHQPQLQPSTQPAAQPQAIALKLVQHPDWNQASSWKQVLNNLSGDSAFSHHIKFTSRLNLFPIPRLSAGLECLIALMNRFLAACHATSHTQISTFLLPRVIEER